MTEDLIRSVVQQVLSQMGNGAAPSNGKPKASGNLGVFATADDAVLAADAAFRAFRNRPLEDRKKASTASARSASSRPRSSVGSSSRRPRSAGSTTRSASSATRSPWSPASSTSAPTTSRATAA